MGLSQQSGILQLPTLRDGGSRLDRMVSQSPRRRCYILVVWLLVMGALAAAVAAEIRTHVESALREAETQHQLKQVEHELQIARSIQQSLLPKIRPQIAGFEVRWLEPLRS